MNQVRPDQSLRQFQKTISAIYSLPDDRLYSISDLLTQMQRFTMRALKGIRKGNKEKLRTNLLISFAWLMPIANRMHIDVEDEVWKRFPGVCSYCAAAPCVCKKTHPKKRVTRDGSAARPSTLRGFQEMFGVIYPPNHPPESRTLADAGIHLAEETGEVSEAIHNFLGQHLGEQFHEIELEIADYVSCIFGVANSASIDIAPALSDMFSDGCHVCHKTPCECTFPETIAFAS